MSIRWTTRKTVGVLAMIALLTTWLMALQLVHASDVDVAVVDVTVPTNSITLAPGTSANITINMSVTGNQEGTATFEVYRNWELSGGTFVGSNPQEFTVGPRAGGSPATTFSTSGIVSVAAGEANGTFTLAVAAFDITNSNTQGAKLAARNSSNYQVTVESPAVPADTTAPTISITTPANGAVYMLNEDVIASFSCQDEVGGSGLKSCVGTVASGIALDTSTVGVKTFKVDAEDNAGNKNSVTNTYMVGYNIIGLSSPVDMGIRNSAKAGQAIPLKWRLLDADGNPVLNLASVKVTVASLSCSQGVTTDDVEEYAAGSSGLQNLGDGYYQFNWKTPTNYANSCKTMYLDLSGSTDASFTNSAKFAAGLMKSAEFAFKK